MQFSELTSYFVVQVFEFVWNIQLRKKQIEIVNNFRANLAVGSSKVKQMIMVKICNHKVIFNSFAIRVREKHQLLLHYLL